MSPELIVCVFVVLWFIFIQILHVREETKKKRKRKATEAKLKWEEEYKLFLQTSGAEQVRPRIDPIRLFKNIKLPRAALDSTSIRTEDWWREELARMAKEERLRQRAGPGDPVDLGSRRGMDHDY